LRLGREVKNILKKILFLDSGPFTLGTAQLGLPYGLGNARSGLNDEQAARILDAAIACGIRWLDTARNYGSAERRIGDFMAARCHRFHVVSKLPSLARVSDIDCARAVQVAIEESLAALRLDKVDAYLTHRAADFHRQPVREALSAAQAQGLIGRYGASLYSFSDANAALDDGELGVLQIPLNVANHATASAELLEKIQRRGIALFARSVFLQGALLMKPQMLPAHLAELSPVVEKLRDIADRAHVPLAGLLMAGARSFPEVFSLVIGTDTDNQVGELANLAATSPSQSVLREAIWRRGGLAQQSPTPGIGRNKLTQTPQFDHVFGPFPPAAGSA
jgi:aryl-alcohol dehydrogenase-like predicted oxidoreductase